MTSRTTFIFKSAAGLCLILGTHFQAANSQAAVLTEGDAEFNGDISVARQFGDGSLTITAPTVLQGGGIFIADQPNLTGNVTVDGGTLPPRQVG